MKKSSVLLVSLLMVIGNYANAQNFKSLLENGSFGVKGGVSLADMIASPSHQIDAKMRGHLGVFYQIPWSEKISFQPELLVSLQGGVQHTFNPTTDYEYISDEKITYLILPLMARYDYSNNITFEAGLQPGFRLSSNYVQQIVDAGSVIYETQEDTREQREFFDLGINLGASYSFNEKLSAGLRYNIGLTPLNVNHSVNGAVKLRNSIVTVSVLYTLFEKGSSGN